MKKWPIHQAGQWFYCAWEDHTTIWATSREKLEKWLTALDAAGEKV